jgi:hypothetical protein
MCSAAAPSNSGPFGADELEALKLKNQELQEELKRLRYPYLAKEVDLAAMRQDEPEIAQLLENNRAWVKSKIVSYIIACINIALKIAFPLKSTCKYIGIRALHVSYRSLIPPTSNVSEALRNPSICKYYR